MYHYNATWLPSKYLTFNVLCSAHFSLFHHLASAQSPSSCQSTNVQMTGCKSGAMSVLLWCYKGLKYRVFLLPDDMNKNIPGLDKLNIRQIISWWIDHGFFPHFYIILAFLRIKWDGCLIGQIDVTEDGWRRNILTLLAPPLLIAPAVAAH